MNADEFFADLAKLPRGFEMVSLFERDKLRPGEYPIINKRTRILCAWTPGGALRVISLKP